MTHHDEELIDEELEQSLDEVVEELRGIVERLEAGGEELTIEYGGESATVPAPTGPVEFEVELERDHEDDEIEVELEVELEWEVPTEDEPGDEAMEADTAEDEEPLEESEETAEDANEDGDGLAIE